MSASSVNAPMSRPGLTPGALLALTLAPVFALLASAAVMAFFLASKKTVFAVAGAIALLVAFALSRNQRLFCLWGLMLTAPFGATKALALITPHMGGASAINMDVCDLFLLGLLAFQLRDWAQGQRRLRLTPIVWLWGGMILLGVIDILLARHRTLALLEIVRMLKCFLLFVVLTNELVRVRQFLHAITALVIGIAMQAGIALVQYAFKANLGLQFLGEPATEATNSATSSVYLGTADIFRAGGLFSHPNLLAGFLALLLPICIALLFSRIAPWIKAVLAGVIALGLAALVVTLSRSGWLSFATGIVLLFGLSLVHRRLRLRYVLARVLVILVLVAAGAGASGEIVRRFTQSDPGALQFRYDMMQSAWDMIVDHPVFGVGLNGFVANFPAYSNPPGPEAVTLKYGTNWPVVHNSYLIHWTQQGTVGFAMLMGIYACVLWTGWRTMQYVVDDRMYAINLGATCGIVAIMVDGIGSFFINENASMRVFWMVVGLIFALHYWTRANQALRYRVALPPSLPVGRPA